MNSQRCASFFRACSWVLLIALLACPGFASGKSQDASKAQSAKQVSPNQQAPARTVPPPDGHMVMPSYSISGRVQSLSVGCTPTGRQVVVNLSRDGRGRGSQNLVLDATGGATFRFDLGSHATVPGTYTLRLEQGAPNPGAYTCTANICMDSVTPASRTVTLSAANRNVSGQDFSIRYSVAFDRSGWCW
jgi:hypothetical protein